MDDVMADHEQVADHHRTRVRPAFRAGTLLLTSLAAAGGCSTGSGSPGTPSPAAELPSWVQGLQEEVSDLPMLATDEPPAGSSISDERPALGTPQSLLGRRTPPGSPSGARVAGGPTGSGPAAAPPESAPAPTPTALEAMFAGDLPARPDRRLRQFGYDLLQGRAATLPALAAGPVAPDHVIATGDRLVLTLRSDQVDRFDLRVDADGTVLIPDIGVVRVAGRTLSEARLALRDAVAEFIVDPAVDLFVGPAGGLVIHIVGEVERPGLLALPSGVTLIEALITAGVRPSGTLRRVEHLRGDIITPVDIYASLLGHPQAQDPRLEHGDRIRIPAIGPTVGVAGSVQRPAIYECDPGAGPLRVADLLRMAGGVTAFTVSDAMQVERTVEGRRRLVDLLERPREEPLQDGDLLLVGAIDGRLLPVVEVRGEIARPGRHQHRAGMTVGDLVRLAGGPLVTAYTRQAFLSRQVGVHGTRDTLLAGVPESTPRRIRVVDLQRALAGDPAHDLPLEPLDLLELVRPEAARETPTIEVIGAVRRPGRYELTADMRVADLVAIAGNLEPDAHRDEAELVRRIVGDQQSLDVRRFRLDLAGALDGTADDPRLATGDRLIVRRLSRAEVRVRIEGRVRFPGEYVLPAGSDIVRMLEAAGGVLPDADLRAAVFTRESVRRQQQDRWNDLVERSRQTMERNLERRLNDARVKEVTSAGLQLEQSRRTLERLRGVQATGRVVVPLADAGFPTSDANLELEPGDRLLVPRRSATVSVVGHVFNPVTVVHRDGISTAELLASAGGLTDLGDSERLYVIRADGTVSGVRQKHGRLRLADPLAAGDVVLVPPQPLDRDWGSVVLDTLLLARTAMEAGLLGRGVIDGVGETNLSIIDSPASPRSDNGVAPDLIRDVSGR